jgi:AbiV family abortive infection protein
MRKYTRNNKKNNEDMKISKRDFKKFSKCVESVLSFYNSAKSFLNDAEILFKSKKYRSCFLCCQLALEDYGMALRLQSLLGYIGNDNPGYRENYKQIKDKYKIHIFKIRGVTDFRFRNTPEKEKLSKLFSKFFHKRRMEFNYVEYNARKGYFVSPVCTRKDAYRFLEITKNDILGWGKMMSSLKKGLKAMVKTLGIKNS